MKILSVYDTKDGEKTLRTSEKEEKSLDGYVCIYECSKHFCHSTYECAFTAVAISINQMVELVEKYKYNYEDI